MTTMTTMSHVIDYCKHAQKVIDIELRELQRLPERLTAQFQGACECLMACQGRVIVTGMGKSGHIGKKIAATLASTGTPAFFVHPAEACHGDLGMLTKQDVILALSYSGETEELINLLPLIQLFKLPLIAMTGQAQSRLALAADYVLDTSVEQEACPLGLAPTASTSLSLVLGDALAISLLHARGFASEDFARFHPGGSLGRRLLMQVKDIMHQAEHTPKVSADCSVADALIEMTQKRLGMTTVIDSEEKLLGIFTDGDLRRLFERGHDIHKTRIGSVMTEACTVITPQMLASDALSLMKSKQITALAVINQAKQTLGVIHLHDLLRAGF
jgi:arabinose-5-phosphate isomerase